MSELEEFEGRIVAALDRVARRLDGAGGGDGALEARIEDLEDKLAEALEDNETLRAKAERADERKRQIAVRMDKRVGRLSAQLEAANEQVHRARQGATELRAALDQLRASVAAGDANADELRRSYETELRALRKARDEEAAELDRLLAELRPLIDAEED